MPLCVFSNAPVRCLVPALVYSVGLIHPHLGYGYPNIVPESSFTFDFFLVTLLASVVPTWLSGVILVSPPLCRSVILFLPLEVSQVADAFCIAPPFWCNYLSQVLPDAFHSWFCFLVCAVLGFSPWLLHPLIISGVVSFGSHTWYCDLTCWNFCMVPLTF